MSEATNQAGASQPVTYTDENFEAWIYSTTGKPAEKATIVGSGLYSVWRPPQWPDDPHDITNSEMLKGSQIREFKKGYWVYNAREITGYYLTNKDPPTHLGFKA